MRESKKNFFYVTLFYFIIIFIYGNCENLSKDEVLNIKLKKNLRKCPSYSDGYSNYSCEYHFYCRGDDCSTKVEKDSRVYFYNTDGKIESFIPDTCNEESIQENNCTTVKCYNDLDCLSNKCINNTCLVNDDLPVIQCMNIESYNSFKFKYKATMNCGKSDYEKCIDNTDCASNNCTESGYCIFNHEEHYADQFFYQFFEIGVIIFVCLFIVFLTACITYCCRHKKNKKRRAKISL
ncbi:hypothetical protein BCR32DRAFT_268425 [Anaeromyces robustus]|uniref:Uncharacterized protein n=1 Tax=Anaeromyces robustus TaxID=1754192 RepID=A0A1Y1X5X0_9FUNG|nr:hypothetical protein BCR32DRAFT_268425 [Anaeromyces robustus]|eukprot:ORX81211.1 hypothetical protein BCR32DRAFT_268425 [Anaeromyces robustus]